MTLPKPKKKGKQKKTTPQTIRLNKFFYLLKAHPEKFLPSLFFLVRTLEQAGAGQKGKFKKVNFLPLRRKFRQAWLPISNSTMVSAFFHIAKKYWTENSIPILKDLAIRPLSKKELEKRKGPPPQVCTPGQIWDTFFHVDEKYVAGKYYR